MHHACLSCCGELTSFGVPVCLCEAKQHPAKLVPVAISLLLFHLPFLDVFEQVHKVLWCWRNGLQWNVLHCVPHKKYCCLFVLCVLSVLFECLQSCPFAWSQSIFWTERVDPPSLGHFLVFHISTALANKIATLLLQQPRPSFLKLSFWIGTWCAWKCAKLLPKWKPSGNASFGSLYGAPFFFSGHSATFGMVWFGAGHDVKLPK